MDKNEGVVTTEKQENMNAEDKEMQMKVQQMQIK